jgi:TonB family protein
MVFAALSGTGETEQKGTASQPYERVMNLRVFEGIKESGSVPAEAVTSSYLKYVLTASIESDSDLEKEQAQIRKTFNLKDVKLLTESSLLWKKGDSRALHLFRLDGHLYEIALTTENVLTQIFKIEVNEQKDKDKANLLETKFTIPKKNIAVFGFEDSGGKPYFLSLREEAVLAAGGIYVLSKPPTLIKKVEPVYPEEARKAGKEGVVGLAARTGVYGRVENIKVTKPADPLLDRAAIEAVRQWIYEPPIIDGKPVSVEFSVSVKFNLDAEKGGVTGGVSGGVAGGVAGGVKGGVEGGVSGGVKGGVETAVVEGVAGGVQDENRILRRREFEKDAVSIIDSSKQPKNIKYVNPVYPEAARKNGIQGVVILEAKIDETGRVIDALILRSIPALNQAALNAVRQWTYQPLIIDGKPSKAVFTVTVNFGLDDKKAEEFAKGAVKVRGDIKPPKPVKVVKTIYPEIARQAAVEGVVLLEARTDVSGRVKDVRVLRSIPLLNQAAIDAVRQWVYEPLIIDGEPREAVFTVTIRFGLEEEGKAGLEKEPAEASGVVEPHVILRVSPVYPEKARRAGIEGTVLLEATTDENGDVVKVRVLKSIPELDQAAIDALRQWKYEPHLVDGKPTSIVFTVTMRFSLK